MLTSLREAIRSPNEGYATPGDPNPSSSHSSQNHVPTRNSELVHSEQKPRLVRRRNQPGPGNSNLASLAALPKNAQIQVRRILENQQKLRPLGQPVKVRFGSGPLGLSIVDAGPRVLVTFLQRNADGSPGQAEASGLVQVGDQIVGVNSNSCRGMNMKQVLNAIAAYPRPLVITFQHFERLPPPQSLPEPSTEVKHKPTKDHPGPKVQLRPLDGIKDILDNRKVLAERASPYLVQIGRGTLGLKITTVQGRVIVSDFDRDMSGEMGQAEKGGQIQIGDELLAVNKYTCKGYSVHKAAELLHGTPRPTILKLVPLGVPVYSATKTVTLKAPNSGALGAALNTSVAEEVIAQLSRCSSCNSPGKSTAKFCWNCGTRMDKLEAESQKVTNPDIASNSQEKTSIIANFLQSTSLGQENSEDLTDFANFESSPLHIGTPDILSSSLAPSSNASDSLLRPELTIEFSPQVVENSPVGLVDYDTSFTDLIMDGQKGTPSPDLMSSANNVSTITDMVAELQPAQVSSVVDSKKGGTPSPKLMNSGDNLRTATDIVNEPLPVQALPLQQGIVDDTSDINFADSEEMFSAFQSQGCNEPASSTAMGNPHSTTQSMVESKPTLSNSGETSAFDMTLESPELPDNSLLGDKLQDAEARRVENGQTEENPINISSNDNNNTLVSLSELTITNQEPMSPATQSEKLLTEGDIPSPLLDLDVPETNALWTQASENTAVEPEVQPENSKEVFFSTTKIEDNSLVNISD